MILCLKMARADALAATPPALRPALRELHGKGSTFLCLTFDNLDEDIAPPPLKLDNVDRPSVAWVRDAWVRDEDALDEPIGRVWGIDPTRLRASR